MAVPLNPWHRKTGRRRWPPGLNIAIRNHLRCASWRSIIFIWCVGGPVCAEEMVRCESSENSIFSCGFKNSKIVSLCGSSDRAHTYVEYRFGSKTKIELNFRSSIDSAEHKFHRGEVIYASNSATVIWFKKGNYIYSIFMPARGGPGLEVTKRGDVVTRMECKDGWTNVKGKHETSSPLITDHGSGDLTKFKPLWESD